MTRFLAATFLAAVLAGGCLVTATTRPGAVVSTSGPDLLFVADGVQVIADYDEPIFFADGFYWWNVDGGWYRSTMYTGGWAYAPRPPEVILRIGDPYRYRHFRPHGYVHRQRPVPSHRIERPRPRRPVPPPPARPRVRDHRDHDH